MRKCTYRESLNLPKERKVYDVITSYLLSNLDLQSLVPGHVPLSIFCIPYIHIKISTKNYVKTMLLILLINQLVKAKNPDTMKKTLTQKPEIKPRKLLSVSVKTANGAKKQFYC